MDADINVRPGRILILDEDLHEQAQTIAALTLLPDQPDIEPVRDVERFRDLIRQADFDVVILDMALSNASAVELIHELKLKDWDPAVLVVSKPVDLKHIADAYNAGCQRCLIKQEDWQDKLAPAVRQALRVKRLERENQRLLIRLTESNGLLAEKNKRLDEFSATIAHDIRGPLGGISMKLEYLSDIYGDELDQRFRDLVTGTLSSTRRLIGVVQAMYEYAKLSSRLGQIEAIQLSSFVEEVIHDLSFAPELDINIGIGDLPQVYGCKGLLRKVFQNLISNAIKYNNKSEIIVNISCIGFEQKSTGEYAKIMVSDNGPGIAPEDSHEIFNMFARGTNSAATEGLGIGLAVVRRIVELHTGDIKVESESGKGASFIFTLPLEPTELTN